MQQRILRLPGVPALCAVPAQLASRVATRMNDDRRKLTAMAPQTEQLGLGELEDGVVVAASFVDNQAAPELSMNPGADE